MQKPRMREQRVGGVEYWKCWMPVSGGMVARGRGWTPNEAWRRFLDDLRDHIDSGRPRPPLMQRWIDWISR